jgi:hypothetical protein
MGDCTIGKELKQSTCRYVKQCRPGWSRNDKFICRKTLRRTNTNKNKNKNKNRSVNSLQLNTPRTNKPDLIKQQMFNIFGNNSPNNLPKLTKKQQAALFRSPRKKKGSTYNATQNKVLLAKKYGRRKVAFLQNKPIQDTFNLRPT